MIVVTSYYLCFQKCFWFYYATKCQNNLNFCFVLNFFKNRTDSLGWNIFPDSESQLVWRLSFPIISEVWLIASKMFLRAFSANINSIFLRSFRNPLAVMFTLLQGFIQALCWTSFYMKDWVLWSTSKPPFWGPKGNTPWNFSCFTDLRFSISLSMHHLVT